MNYNYEMEKFKSIRIRLTRYILMVLLFLSLLSIALVLVLSIVNDYNSIEESREAIKSQYLETIRKAIWEFDYLDIELNMRQIQLLPFVSGVELQMDDNRFLSGSDEWTQKDWIFEFDIDQEDFGKLGTLKVIFSRELLLQEHIRILIALTIIQLPLVIGAVAALLILIQHNITIPMKELAFYTQDLSLDNLKSNFSFNRNKKNYQDELDLMNGSINKMKASIHQQMEKQKKAEKMLLQYQKMNAVGQLVSGVAHDFNNMLTGIYSALDLMDQDLSPNEKKECLNAIRQSAERANALTDQLLNFTRKKKGTSHLINIAEILEKSKGILSRSIDPRVNIKIQISDRNLYILGDESDIENGLINLTINGAQAMDNSGTIELNCRSVFLSKDFLSRYPGTPNEGDYICISVRDYGSGIEAAHLNRIFEPFFTTKEHGKGTGLGLASVFSMMERHNGLVDLDSEPGKGTVFYLYFPSLKQENLP